MNGADNDNDLKSGDVIVGDWTNYGHQNEMNIQFFQEKHPLHKNWSDDIPFAERNRFGEVNIHQLDMTHFDELVEMNDNNLDHSDHKKYHPGYTDKVFDKQNHERLILNKLFYHDDE